MCAFSASSVNATLSPTTTTRSPPLPFIWEATLLTVPGPVDVRGWAGDSQWEGVVDGHQTSVGVSGCVCDFSAGLFHGSSALSAP